MAPGKWDWVAASQIEWMLSRLTPLGEMTDNSPVEARTTLDRLRAEAGELRASRRASRAGRRCGPPQLERELHDGVQQHLVALAVDLQLAGRLARRRPAAAQALLDEMARDVQRALDETAQARAADLPSAARGRRARRGAARGGGSARHPRLASTSRANGATLPRSRRRSTGAGSRRSSTADAQATVTVSVRDEDGALAFEVVAGSRRDSTGSRPRRRARRPAVVRRRPAAATRVSGLPPAHAVTLALSAR